MFDNGVFFFAQCVRECSRLCVRKWGAQRPREGNPYFYSVLWVSEGQQLAQQASQICNVVPGQHAENEASSKKNPDYDTSTYTLASDEYEVCTCPSRADMPRTAGRMGFFRFAVSKFRWKGPKTRNLEKWQNIFVLARPSSFCAFWWRAWISPKNGFLKIDKFSLKPLKT